MTERDTILIADDAQVNRAILHSLFENEYDLLETESGAQVLTLLRQHPNDIAVVLLDLIMPEVDGYEILEEMHRSKLINHIPVIVITAEDSSDSRIKVFELGASDVLAKPFESEVVRARVKNIIELGRYRRSLEAMVGEKSKQVRDSNAAIIDMLSSLVECRSLESGQHIRRIRFFTNILLYEVARTCQEYNLSERKIKLITEASSMHDIGKIAIPDSILNKPGKLTPAEFEIMKTHTVRGCDILCELDRLQDKEYLEYAYLICRYHHERWDGRGYPEGLKRNSIPICAQVAAIADCYDALTTDRVYKKAIPPCQAISMILNGECGAFSDRLLSCFQNVRAPFTELSEKYADGQPAESVSDADTPDSQTWKPGETALERDRQQYSVLLRYLDATVIEADLDADAYRTVYLQDRDFSTLATDVSLKKAIRHFAETSVHPADQEAVLALLDENIRELFDEGMTRRDGSYRIRHRETGAYVRCHTSVLRSGLDDPREHKVLLVWRKAEEVPGKNTEYREEASR